MQSQRPYTRGLIALSVWIGHHGLNCKGCPNHEFPYEALVPTDGRRQRFSSAEDFREPFLELIAEKPQKYTLGQHLYANYRSFACPNQIDDQEAQGLLMRYVYCKNTGVLPYAGAYDDQPVSWMESYGIIESEAAAAARCQCALCKVSHG